MRSIITLSLPAPLPLAAEMRRMLRPLGIRRTLPAIFSPFVQDPAKSARGFFPRLILSLLSAHGAEHATKDVFNERHKS